MAYWVDAHGQVNLAKKAKTCPMMMSPTRIPKSKTKFF